MSAYKEKMMAEEHINYLMKDISMLEAKLSIARELLKEEEQNLAEAEQDIKWEAQNDR